MRFNEKKCCQFSLILFGGFHSNKQTCLNSLAYIYLWWVHINYSVEKILAFDTGALYYAILAWSRRDECVHARHEMCVEAASENLLRCHFNIEWKSCHVYIYLLQLITSTCHIMYASLIDISDIPSLLRIEILYSLLHRRSRICSA